MEWNGQWNGMEWNGMETEPLAETDTDPTKAMMAVNLYYDMVAGNKELDF